MRAYAQDSNWFLNGKINNLDVFGLPVFYTGTGATVNRSSYESDGYFKTTQNGSIDQFNIYTNNKIPVNEYSSIKVKFKQTLYNAGSDVYAFTVGFRASNTSLAIYTNVENPVRRTTTANSIQEIIYDLTSYNANGIEKYLILFGHTNSEIYEITFVK